MRSRSRCVGPDRDGVAPHLGRWFAPDGDDHVAAAGERGLRTPPGGGGVEQHERRLGPVPACLGGVDHAVELAARRRGEPQDTVEQLGVRHHHQPASLPVDLLADLLHVASSSCRSPVER